MLKFDEIAQSISMCYSSDSTERYSVDWKANCVLQKRHFDRKKVEPQLGDDMKFNRDDEHVKS